MFWIKVLSIGISSLLVFTNGLPTSVLLDSKAAALKSEAAEGQRAATKSVQQQQQVVAGKSGLKKRGAVLPEASVDLDDFLPRDLYLLNKQEQQQQQRQNAPGTGFWADLEDGFYDGGRGAVEADPREGAGGFYDNYYGYTPYEEDIAELINPHEGFSEPVAMPLVYSGAPSPSRGPAAAFYGLDSSSGGNGYRNKRSNMKKRARNFRLKRENNRIDAAEALALLELIQAQEEARRRPTKEEDYYRYLVSAGGDNNPDEEVWGERTEPSAHFYSPPPQVKYSPFDYYGHGAAKRFMVARRKKRASTSNWGLRHG